MRKVMLIILIGSIPAFFGCATIVSGTSQTLTINSEPPGAVVLSEGKQIGLTPLASDIKRGQDKVLLVKKEGYQDEEVKLKTQFNTMFFGNILFGGTFGSSTDFASDAVVEYAPDSYFVTLKPNDTSQIDRDIFGKKRQVRSLVLLTHRSLTLDIVRGEGEYLSTLYAAMGVREGEKPEMLGLLKEMVSRHESVPAFAEDVVGRSRFNPGR
jgi:hypothetical protein